MNDLVQDVRFGLRTLASNPGFAAVAILSLALGIGANSAIFSVLNAVVLRSLPVPHPEQLSMVHQQSQRPGAQRFSYPMLASLRDVAPASTAIAGMSRIARLHTTVGDARQQEITRAQLVSGEYFSVLDYSLCSGVFSPPTTIAPPERTRSR